MEANKPKFKVTETAINSLSIESSDGVEWASTYSNEGSTTFKQRKRAELIVRLLNEETKKNIKQFDYL